MQTPTITVIKKVAFSAAHFFWLPQLSDAENRAHFGPTSNRNGHGHNYTLSVAVSGPCNPETGMVINLKDLKTILHDTVVTPLNFNSLNHDVPFFKHHLPTLELLALWVWVRVAPPVEAAGLTLNEIHLAESDDLWVTYDGANLEALCVQFDLPKAV
ncbi:MAG: 6-carboxytetrahydropterin synthase [Candidatus Melainabacteria bacterium]